MIQHWDMFHQIFMATWLHRKIRIIEILLMVLLLSCLVPGDEEL